MTAEWSEKKAEHYICYRTTEPIVVDGVLNEPAWSYGRIGDSDNHIPERFARVRFSTLPAEKM